MIPETFYGVPVVSIDAYNRSEYYSPFPSDIETINLPANLTRFGKKAFYGLYDLIALNVYGEGDPDYHIANTPNLKILYLQDFKGERYLIAAVKDITSFDFTDPYYFSIYPYAFHCCSSLRSVTIDCNNVDSVGEGAFKGCGEITFYIHGGITKFNKYFNSDNLPSSYTIIELD